MAIDLIIHPELLTQNPEVKDAFPKVIGRISEVSKKPGVVQVPFDQDKPQDSRQDIYNAVNTIPEGSDVTIYGCIIGQVSSKDAEVYLQERRIRFSYDPLGNL